jgi:hypothetical protein
MLISLLLGSLALCICLAGSSPPGVQMEQMEPTVSIFSSPMWIQEPIDRKQVIKIVFVMKHEKEDVRKFEANLLELASPHSKRYGQWLKVKHPPIH